MAEVDLQIESILEELRRAEEIDKQNAQIKEEIDEHSESIENLEEETNELAEKIGLDENEKSIIDKNQLKASLSSSEKKRYQNIGKEFIEGAGKEFKNILKASKFKSMMSTVKEKFTAGIKKVKSAIKKVKKASGFLGKLMLIVGLLGAIFYVFKDKIMNAVPNITGFIKDIFEKAKNFIGKFVENAFDFIKGGAKSFLAGGVSGLIGYLKDSLVIFFSRTLPDAIFGLYVNILSMFGNDDAQDLQSEIENSAESSTLEETSNEIADRAEAEIKSGEADNDVISNAQKIVDQSGDNLDQMSNAELTKLQAVSSSAQFSQFDENSELIKQLSGLVEGNKDILQMVKDGQVDTRQLFENVRQASQDGNLSREEAFNALKKSISDEATAAQLQFRKLPQPEQGDVVIEDENLGNSVANTTAKIRDAANSAREAQGDSFSKLIDMANRDKETQDRISSELERRRQEQSETNVIESDDASVDANANVTINAVKVIEETLKEAFLDLTTTMKKFLDGDIVAKSITNGLKNLNDNFVQFFNAIRDYANTLLGNIADVANYFNTYFDGVANLVKDSSDKIQSQTEVQNAEEANTSRDFVINVNVSLSDKPTNQYAFIKDVVSIDADLNEQLDETNKILEKISKRVDKIKSLGSGDASSANVKVDQKTINNMVDNHVKNTYINTFTEEVTNQITNDNSIINKITSNVVNNETVMNQLLLNVTNNNILIEEIVDELLDNNTVVNTLVQSFVQTISSNTEVVNKVMINISNNNDFIEEIVEEITDNSTIVNQLSDTIISNVTNNSTVLNEMTTNIFKKNTEFYNDITEEIVEEITDNSQIITQIAQTLVNNIINNEKVLNEFRNTVITNNDFVEEVVEEITDNSTTMHNLVYNVINNESVVTTIANQISNNHEVLTTVKNYTVNYLKRQYVTNRSTIVQDNCGVEIVENNPEEKTCLINFTDKNGHKSSIRVFDKERNDEQLQILSNGINMIGKVVVSNTNKANQNALNISKLGKICSANMQTHNEVNNIESVHALKV